MSHIRILFPFLAALPLLAQLPNPQITKIVNAATLYAPDGVLPQIAPGLIISVFGIDLTDGSTASAAEIPLPTRLAGARLLVNGIAAPLFYASRTQINAQVPTELAAGRLVQLQVETQWPAGTVTGASQSANVNAFAPGIFTLDANGKGPGVILRASDYSVICPPGRADCASNPARPGETVLIYAAGLGPVDGPWISGLGADGVYRTTITPRLWMGGLPALVLFSGLAPGFVGLYQLNAVVPGNGRSDDAATVSLSMDPNGATSVSNVVTLSIAATVCPSSGPQGALAGTEILSLALNPTNPQIVFAGTAGKGLFKTSDAGNTWNAVPGLPQTRIHALAFAPSNASVLYAGTELGVYRSRDGGNTWTDVALRYGGPATSIVVDPRNAALVYAGHTGIGVIKSTDSGDNWTVIYPPSPGSNPVVRVVTIDPRDSDILYFSVQDVGAFRSFHGQTTTAINSGLPPGQINAFSIQPVNSETIVAGTTFGIYLTSNAGAAWMPSNAGMDAIGVNALVLNPQAPGILYAGTARGAYWSFNTGQTWAAINRGLPACSVPALAIDPTEPHTLYAATASAGIFKSTDGGSSWFRPGAN